MPKMKQLPVRFVSRGFQVWKDLEKERGREVKPAEIASATGVDYQVINMYLRGGEEDLSGKALGPAILLAEYFGIPIEGEEGLLRRVKIDS